MSKGGAIVGTCHNLKENLILHAYGELDATAGKEVENHLEICEPCRQEWQRLLSLLGKLKETVESHALSSLEVKSLVAKIKENLKNTQKEKWWQRYLHNKPSRMIPALVTACILVISAAIVSYVKVNDSQGLNLFSKNQNEELMLSDKDLEIVKNLELLKEMDAIQKLSQVVDLNGETNSQGEIDNGTRGMRQDAYRQYLT